jgi:hypothetical protein
MGMRFPPGGGKSKIGFTEIKDSAKLMQSISTKSMEVIVRGTTRRLEAFTGH